MRNRNPESSHAGRRCDRRSFMDASARKIALVSGGIILSAIELLQPKNPQKSLKEESLDPYELQQILRTELGNISFSEQYAKRESNPDETSTDPFVVASAAIDRLEQENLGEMIANSFRWANSYQLSEEAASHLDQSALDCNDTARRTCDRLSKHSIPMYLLSICPQNARQLFEYEWHQMATCKMGREYYLVIDNESRATLWHGTLHEFVAQRDSDVSMRILPMVGISRYIEPKHDIAPSKFLMQLVHAEGENDMEWLNISAPLNPRVHLA
ncbi:MAG: hypothetical protein ABIA92_01640 [Patescibacteria group bacterium]